MLYWDIASLQAIGAQIEGEPGLCHVLKPGFLPTPLMVSDQKIEAPALELGWIGRRTDDGRGQSAHKERDFTEIPYGPPHS